jgi:hypothetical protein
MKNFMKPSVRIILTTAIGLMVMAAQVSAQVTISNKKDVTCHGAKDGSATASVQGGTPPYTYLWTPSGGTSATASGLSGGNYTVEVTDANQCKASASVTIAEPGPMSVSIAGSGAVVEYCSNQKAPSVTLTASASGGFPPYSYSWPGGSITVNSSGNWPVTVTDSKGCSKSNSGTTTFIPVECSQDPNDITGPQGYDTIHWIPKNQVMPFTIRFENDPVFATAPAQRVSINLKVDTNLSIFSYRMGTFGFGSFVFQVPANTTFYAQRLDVRDSLGVFVDVLAGIDVIKNELFWIFESIDPLTGQSPIDARVGFLPVNDSIFRRGEGYVSYTILPKTTVQSGDTTVAQAIIVFDVNEPIATNIWKNTIDALPPTSKVVDNFLTYSDTTSIFINFQGNDDIKGTGIKSYRLFYSKNNGPYTFHQEYDADSLVTFNTTSGYYKFFSIAVDYVGNEEPMKTMPDADINIINNLRYSIEGLVSYKNFNTTPLRNSLVYLKEMSGANLDTLITDSTGAYQFHDIRTGSYILDGSVTFPWGGVNATDALLINRSAAQMVNLDASQIRVADVNASNTVTATDALLALRRSLGLDNSFASGDWYVIPDTVMVIGDSLLNHTVFALCYGDVNRSYQPTNARLFRSVTPVYDGLMEVYDQEFTYPITLLTPAIAGAISLTLTYPADQVEITGITFKGKELLFNDLGGVVRIGWQQIQGEAFDADELLLGINMKKLPVLIAQKSIQPRLIQPNEIADVLGDVIYGTRLQMPEVVFRASLPDQFAMISNYPNPCSQTTMFHFQTPEAGSGEIRIFNMLGELTDIIPIGDLEAGEHQHQIDVSKFASGVYHYTLHITGSTQNYSAAGRLIIGIKP